MDQKTVERLKTAACRIRMGIIESTFRAKSGHPGGSLSSADILTYLYFYRMNVDPADPHADGRDRFVLSKGHAAPALYSTLANRGYFPVEELKTLRRIGSRLQGHPNMNLTPGVDMSTGSLGQGVSVAAGMALGAKMRGDGVHVYALLGDGELQEGQVWESLMFSAHHKLDTLTVIIDNNGLQIDGRISDVMSPYPIADKLEAFGFRVREADGHDFESIDRAFEALKDVTGAPTAVLLHTVKGKGISFMENNVLWHYRPPQGEEYEAALKELEAQRP